MEFGVLGHIEVSASGAAVALRGARQRTLVAALLLHAGAPVTQGRLIELVWGDAPPPTAAASLRVHLSQLRRALGPAGRCIRTAASAYVLDVSADSIDAHRFEALLGAAQAQEMTDPGAAFKLLEQALGLWRGAAYADADFAVGPEPEVERLEELRLHAIEKRIEVALVLGRHRHVIPELEGLVAAHPFREALWAHLVVALYRSGRQAEALRRYQDIRGKLRDELGIAPSPDLHRLEIAILNQSEELLGPTGSAEQPAGPELVTPLTFLLTDVVSSTALWITDPAMAAAVARQEDIISSTVESHGGRLVDARGARDSTFSAFSTASDAVRAALAIQRAMLGETWPTQSPIQIRMAIHTGVSERRGGSYVGAEVNRAARLRSLAHGGQTVVSAATAALLDGALPGDARLTKLGAHRLAGLDRTSFLFQLSASGLADRFPPLPDVATPHNLPASATSFIGRDKELRDLLALLERRRLVTLVGPGGSGKTRLALELTREIADEFPDGTWLVDLYAVAGEADAVHAAVAASLGLRDEPGVHIVDSIRLHLRSRRALIIVDNCEHVVDAAAETIAQLLAAGEALRVVATSREPLAIDGEALYRIHPLAVPGEEERDIETIRRADAFALFLDRVHAADSDFVLDESSVATVSDICRRLDGIPLALELVAARAHTMSMAELSQSLDDRFTLTHRRRATTDRHRGLAAVVDWSFQLLACDERAALCELSTFAGSFTADAGASVAGASVEMVRRLADKSLLEARQHGATTRFRLLETVREYVGAQLSDQERERAAERHLDWYREAARRTAGRLDGPDAEAALDTLEGDHHEYRRALQFGLAKDDARSACELALRLARFWSMRGHMTDGLSWLDQAVRVAPDEALRARLLTAVGNILVRLGRHRAGVDALSQALTTHRLSGDEAAVAYTLGWLANAELKQGHIDNGRGYLDKAVRIAERLSDDRLTALLVGACGDSLQAQGRSREATEQFQRALEIAIAHGDRHAEAQALLNLGDTAAGSGSDVEANTRYDAALALFDQLSDRSCTSVVLDRLADRAAAATRHDDAVRLQARALIARLGIGERKDAARSTAVLARLATLEKKPVLAARLLGAADALAGSLSPQGDTEASTTQAAAIRCVLGDDEFRQAWSAGYQMSESELAELVLLMGGDS